MRWWKSSTSTALLADSSTIHCILGGCGGGLVVAVVDVKWEMVGQETLAHMVMLEIEVVQTMFVDLMYKVPKVLSEQFQY